MSNNGQVDSAGTGVRLWLPDGVVLNTQENLNGITCEDSDPRDCVFARYLAAGANADVVVNLMPLQSSVGTSGTLFARAQPNGVGQVAPPFNCAPSDSCKLLNIGPIGNGVDLAATIDPPSPALVGGVQSTYLVKFTNNGSGLAIKPRLNFKVPLASLSAGAAPTSLDWDCTGPTNGLWQCTSKNDLPAGASFTVPFSVNTNQGALGDVRVWAGWDSTGGTDPAVPDQSCTPAANCASYSSRPLKPVGISVNFGAAPEEFVAGKSIAIPLTATNSGDFDSATSIAFALPIAYAALDKTGVATLIDPAACTPPLVCTQSVSSTIDSNVNLSLAFGTLDKLAVGKTSVLPLNLNNAGSAIGNNAQINLVLPAGIILSPPPVGASCAGAPQTCTITMDAPPGSTSLNLSLLPQVAAADKTGDIYGTVNASGIGAAPLAFGCSASSTCAIRNTDVVSNGVALSIGLTGPIPALGMGITSKYQVTVANSGTADAASQNFKFSLPASMQFMSVDAGADWICNPDGLQVWSCTRGIPMVAQTGQSVASINVTPAPTAAGSTVVIQAALDPSGAAMAVAPAACSAPLACVSSSPATVASNVDLSVEFDQANTAFAVGKPSTVLLTVKNGGSVNKDNLPIRISLADGLIFDQPPSNLSCGSRVGKSYECAFIATAPANGSVSSTLSLTADATLANRAATIYALIDREGNALPAVGDGTCVSSATCKIKDIGPIDNGVQLRATLSDPDVPLGMNVSSTYTLTLTNDGTADARARFKLWIPESLDWKTTRTEANWTCLGAAPMDCSSSVPLKPNGDTAIANIAVMPNRVAQTVVIEAGISPQGSDAQIDAAATCDALLCVRNTQAGISSNVDLSVAVSAPLPVLNVGAISEYRFDIRNNGVADARTAQLRIAVPQAMSVSPATASGNGWTCSSGAAITCNFAGSIAASGGESSVMLKVVTDVLQAGNDAVVSGSVDVAGGAAAREPSGCRVLLECASNTTLASNITATVVLRPSWVQPLPTLKVGAKSTYRLLIANAGAVSASAATAQVRFAPGVIYESFEGNGWSCAADGSDVQLVGCVRSTPLDARAESTIAFNVAVTSDVARHDVVQYASVDVEGGSNPASPGLPCNEAGGCVATMPSNVDSGVELSFGFEGPTPELRVGAQSTYRLILNNGGTAAATGAKVRILIPNGMEFVSHVSDNWNCTHDAELLTCEFTKAERVESRRSARTIGLDGEEIIEFTVSPQASFGNTSYVQHVAVVLPGAAAGESIPGPGCFPAALCSRSAVNQVSGSSDSLLLAKSVGSRKVEIGDLVTYTLSVKNPGVSTATAVSIQDRLPAGFRIEKRTTQMLNSQSGAVSSAEPTASARVLKFQLGNLPGGATAEVSYRLRVGIGAKIGTAINRAQAVSSNGLSSSNASATVEVTAGVFGDDGCIAGKVFVDANGDGIQSDGEQTIAGAKIYLQNGMHFTTDWAGRYSFCGVKSRSNVIKLDKRSIPAGCTLKVLSNTNMGDGGSIFLGASNGHLQRGDFAVGNCSAGAIQDIERRNAAAMRRRTR